MTTLADITSKSKRPLPKGWQWVRLKDLVELNPRRPAALHRGDDAATSFVPMEAVDEVTGTVARTITRPFGEIKQGYTGRGKPPQKSWKRSTPCRRRCCGARSVEESHVVKAKPETSTAVFMFKVALSGRKSVWWRIAAGGVGRSARRKKPRVTGWRRCGANENAGVSGRRWTGDAIPGGVANFDCILHRPFGASSEGFARNGTCGGRICGS